MKKKRLGLCWSWISLLVCVPNSHRERLFECVRSLSMFQ
jgi:hypothetical protein